MKSNQLIAKFVDVLNDLSEKGFNIPGLIMSSPGAGKTSSIEMYAKVKDCNLISLIASQYSADDILGLQSVNQETHRLVRLTPSWYNHLLEKVENGKRTILFIDEITTCDEFIQAPLLNLIFNRSLGEETLPKNVFIVAAGNYTEELNGAFSMTAPLVNRFLILNLMNEDFSTSEVLQETFESIDDSNYATFLDLVPAKKPQYDPKKFIKWATEHLPLTESNFVNSREMGLLGFTSVRSLDYSIKFMRAYVEKYDDDDWIRIVGDTLGRFKSGDNKLVLRDKIGDDKSKFYCDNSDYKADFINVLRRYVEDYRDFRNGKLPEEPDIEELKSLLDPMKMSAEETRTFKEIFQDYNEDWVPGKVYKEFLEKEKALNDSKSEG